VITLGWNRSWSILDCRMFGRCRAAAAVLTPGSSAFAAQCRAGARRAHNLNPGGFSSFLPIARRPRPAALCAPGFFLTVSSATASRELDGTHAISSRDRRAKRSQNASTPAGFQTSLSGLNPAAAGCFFAGCLLGPMPARHGSIQPGRSAGLSLLF